MASTPTRDLPEDFLAATRKSQEVAIRAIKTWVETVRTVTPKLPSVKLPSVTAPLTDKLPKPEDVVASGYDFAEQLLAIQRKFAEGLLAATEPLISVSSKRAWQDVTKKDAAAAAEKTAAAAKTAVTETAQAARQVVAQAAPEPTAPKAPAPRAAPKRSAAKSTPKPASPKPAAAKRAPKPATRRAPKATGTS